MVWPSRKYLPLMAFSLERAKAPLAPLLKLVVRNFPIAIQPLLVIRKFEPEIRDVELAIQLFPTAPILPKATSMVALLLNH